MDVAIGLPNTVPGVQRDQLLEFARRGEAKGFASLGTLDRLVYAGLDPLAKDEETVRERIKAFSDAGCDELLFFPTSPDPEQGDLLAAAAL